MRGAPRFANNAAMDNKQTAAAIMDALARSDRTRVTDTFPDDAS
jgi:hypothetical protein